VCAVAAAGGATALVRAGRRPGARPQPYRLLLAAVATGAVGVAVAGVQATWVGAAGRPERLRLAFEIDAAHAVATGLMVTGLLLLPGVAATVRARLRRLLDGFILAACLFYTAWTLALQPLHEAYLGQPTPIRLGAGCLALAVPTLVTLAAVGILAVTVRPGDPAARWRTALLAGGGAILAGAGAVGLAAAISTGTTGATVPAAAAYAGGQVLLAVSVRPSGDLAEPVPETGPGSFGLSVWPLGLALVAAVIRLAFLGPIDGIEIYTAVAIGAAVLGQQAVARRDLRRYAARLQDSEAHFRQMAHTDALTGLGNRRQLLHTLYSDAVGGPPCVLLAIDLDGFKNINDIRGHDVGDAVLVEVAQRLRGNLRPGDLAARLGGDEFAVLMWAGPREAKVVAKRLLDVLAQPYELPAGTVFTSASMGLAGCATADDVETLLRNADLALRFAKQRGKNRVERYDLAYDHWVRRRTELEHELRGALDRGELMLVYQPVVTLPEGRVTGVEALLRWHHPTLGTVPPDEFIPLAEDAGLIEGLGAFVLHEACHQLARWHADGHELYLAVNVSVRELHTPEYAVRVSEALRAHRLAPERLVVEVTEHAVALDVEQLVSRLVALRDTGVRVALDDFGSGYSSLGQLRTLPVDILKIDRSVLAQPDEAQARFAPPLVDVVVRLGNRLGLDVVAEGITDSGQRRVVEEAGCRFAQGDLFGRALPAERVETLFTADAVPTIPVQNLGSVDSTREMRQS
jgi:diguanylate cyclase (GGDEF)-like protein